MDYAKFSEAPRHMHFWAAVSAVAGALRRKVWIDQAYFKWYCNMYIVFVAPPGIVSKSTTAGIAMELLRRVPGIKFGPDVVTWPSLVEIMANGAEAFEYKEAWHPMSAITLESSEFGNLLDPRDKDMVDLLVSLWDGKQGAFSKNTKTAGNDKIENPWINLIACTTPSWIAGNFPEYMIGGGFTSRTIFVYADAKAQYVAYPSKHVPADMEGIKTRLVEDLAHIANTVTGEYVLTPEAFEWGEAWYKKHFQSRPANMDMDRFGGYFARKQTMIHKLAMILAASSSDELSITPEHLDIANTMVTDLEPDMQFVFSKIGRSDDSIYMDKLIGLVQSKGKEGVLFAEAYRYVHAFFPSMRDFEDFLAGCIKADYIRMETRSGGMYLVSGGASPPVASNGVK